MWSDKINEKCLNIFFPHAPLIIQLLRGFKWHHQIGKNYLQLLFMENSNQKQQKKKKTISLGIVFETSNQFHTKN